MRIVMDTNVLVSAILTPAVRSAWLVGQVLAERYRLCYDLRILEEYRNVLLRPKFHLNAAYVGYFLEGLLSEAYLVAVPPLKVEFIDQGDKKFFEVAKYCQATLVTGNLRHFPEDPLVVSVADFCAREGA